MTDGPILIVKTGSTLPGVAARSSQDFEDWITEKMGVAPERVRVARVTEGEQLPSPRDLAAVVVTGSAAMVTSREPWSEMTGAWLASAVAAETPVLGICYGHQLLADALGGRVGRNPRGREIGTVAVQLTDAGAEDPLLGVLPRDFQVQATHLESVLELPPQARLLAGNRADPHQAFVIGPHAWAVQFHPELDADAIRGYIEGRREIIAREGQDPDALLARTADTDHGHQLLRRFAELVDV